MWIKYSRKPITSVDRLVFKQSKSVREFAKPSGFWITDDGPENWKAWCKDAEFLLADCRCKHAVTLDERNVLFLRRAQELIEFTEAYGSLGDFWCGIDWRKVATRHTGIIIVPYQWSCRLHLSWYYGWDCASGCIWDTNIIRDIELLETAET